MAKHAHTTPTSIARRSAPTGSRSGRKGAALPDTPPLSAEELQHKRDILAQLHDIHAKVVRRNLETAVLLAQQAARHGGELAEHFGELGRRFGHLLDAKPNPRLRVVKGGAA